MPVRDYNKRRIKNLSADSKWRKARLEPLLETLKLIRLATDIRQRAITRKKNKPKVNRTNS